MYTFRDDTANQPQLTLILRCKDFLHGYQANMDRMGNVYLQLWSPFSPVKL